MSELRPGGRREGYGACDDAAMQEQGVSKILTINLNDMAKEFKIKWGVESPAEDIPPKGADLWVSLTN